MPSGGQHVGMRAFTTTEDAKLMGLFAEHGPRWKLIAAEMSTQEGPRSAAMVRNRWLRVQKGKQRAAQGLARNKCGHCGQIKQGHICAARVANASVSLAAQQRMHEESRVLVNSPAADANLPPLAPSSVALELGSPQPLTLDQENIATASLFAPPAGLITCNANARAPPIAAAALVWSPQTGSPDLTASPGISAASLAASLLAPTPEGIASYSFPPPAMPPLANVVVEQVE